MALKVSRILHAGYVFECDGTQVAFDPIFENPFSRNCYAFPECRFDHEQIQKLHFDAVFISHFHDDHCSLESLDLLPRETPIYIYCLFEELLAWIRELGFTQVFPLKIDHLVRIGTFEIIPRRALDADVDSLFQIKASGLNVLNVVDSWIDEETLQDLVDESPWDLILWPFQTMREIEVLSPLRAESAPIEIPREWREQLKALRPRYVVPSSCQFKQEPWSWYNQAFFPISYRQFQQEVEFAVPDAQVVRLNPSVSIVLDKSSLQAGESLSWVLPSGEQDLDYEYEKNLKPPSTAEVARRFPPLSATQTERVFEYCHVGLLEKYSSLEAPEDPFFHKPRIWKLSLYDHMGKGYDFHYRLKRARIEILSQCDEPLAWWTEVSIHKLYSALECGESLTSMYLRINDQFFEADIEKDIPFVDIVEDPLVRCLFNGAFGSYQKAQLERLRSSGTDP